MDWLELARGPVLTVSLLVFILGAVWRLRGILRLPRRPDRSPAREGAPSATASALRGILAGLRPRRGFGPAAWIASVNGLVFHLGLALIFFGYAPHIAFIHRLTGLSWPALPDMVMYVATAVTIVSLLMALSLRLTSVVLRRISGRDDYLSWTLTFLPILTGMAVVGEPSSIVLARGHAIYPGPLAVHLLALELLLVWFPFGKLMHAVLFFFSRAATGMRFGHRGVEL